MGLVKIVAGIERKGTIYKKDEWECKVYFPMLPDGSLCNLLVEGHTGSSTHSVHPPKGLPEDLSSIMFRARKNVEYSGSVKGESWVTVGELEDVQVRCKQLYGKESPTLTAILLLMKELAGDYHPEIRLVFWHELEDSLH